MPDAPPAGYALFDLPRPMASFWELVRDLDEYMSGARGLVPDPDLQRAWQSFHTQAAAYTMRRSCPVVPGEGT